MNCRYSLGPSQMYATLSWSYTHLLRMGIVPKRQLEGVMLRMPSQQIKPLNLESTLRKNVSVGH